jgi:hypothetical protein
MGKVSEQFLLSACRINDLTKGAVLVEVSLVLVIDKSGSLTTEL